MFFFFLFLSFYFIYFLLVLHSPIKCSVTSIFITHVLNFTATWCCNCPDTIGRPLHRHSHRPRLRMIGSPNCFGIAFLYLLDSDFRRQIFVYLQQRDAIRTQNLCLAIFRLNYRGKLSLKTSNVTLTLEYGFPSQIYIL